MNPLNNGHIIDDFNYEQDDIYVGSSVIWRAVRYAAPPVQTLEGHLAPAPTLDMSFTHSQNPFFAPVSPSSIGSTGAPAQLSGHETGTNYNFEALDLTDGNLVPPEVPLLQGDWAGQWPTIGSLDAVPVQLPSEPQDAVHSPLAKVNQLRNDLQLWDSLVLQALPELDYSQLIDLRSFVKATFCKLDTSIQERLDLGAPNIPSPRDRYLCKLCSQGNRKVYGTRGTFRRHVSLTHQAEHKYYCPACSFSTPRRDKFRGHLQVKHGSFALTLLNKGCLDNLARPCPPPKTCGLCPKQVNTWKRYFECIVKHCRLPGGSSAYTSASQSRRGSGNTGGDGTDFGGQQGFGPSGNDGSGFPPSSSVEGDNMGGGDYDFNNIGQQFSFHAASLSQHNTQASLAVDTIDEAEQSPPFVTNAHARTRPNSVLNKDGPEHLSPVHSPTSLQDYHRTLNSTLKEGSPTSTKRNHSLDSFKQLSAARNAPHSSNSSGRSRISNARPSPTDENPRKNQFRNLEKSCQTKCRTCGHTMQSCTHCTASDGAERKCHLCAGKARQRSNQSRPWHQETYPDHAYIPRKSLSPPWKLGRELDLTSQVFEHELFLQESRKELVTCTKTIIPAVHPTSIIFPYAVSQRTKPLLVLHNNLQSDCMGILTAKLESYGNRPFLPCSQGSHALGRPGTYNTRTSRGLLNGHDVLTRSAILMSEMATQPCITLTEKPATLSIASAPHALDLSAWDNVPDSVAIARKQLPLCSTEVQMQLLDDALDSASPDLTDTTVILRRRSHMLQTRLRVIVKLLKLKTTVANVIELEAPKAHKLRSSEITPDYPGLIEFTVDLPIRDETLSLSQLWSIVISNAGMIVGGFASTALDTPNLNDGRDDLQLLFMMLIHILMKFAEAPIRPVNTMLVE
ncbi:putative C2H2 zinc finger domain protein [Aspergillus fischeri NRRL 181]|uniref:C2H2 type zinc finger domain protein n=1 Tax=Neosartorya fischeri (strain ATCC 1020 / DSM 3700 / CBS 544.65 / FGSC A1164 / JCM 1740 / NRRL 181 / WB 181) TaxID=331117 RepID=A1D817_NEOFI|nr:C2H2 type zinc finger domain protein [Aspergillus fischeri NRRL 181]EAW21861.1 C2H2 type zinc finger domain protein [Aspergillus fischeri NRRL 181]